MVAAAGKIDYCFQAGSLVRHRHMPELPMAVDFDTAVVEQVLGSATGSRQDVAPLGIDHLGQSYLVVRDLVPGHGFRSFLIACRDRFLAALNASDCKNVYSNVCA